MGPAAWKGMDKMNSELFTLTYGALVAQLLRDHEDVDAVNAQLDKMGYVSPTHLLYCGRECCSHCLLSFAPRCFVTPLTSVVAILFSGTTLVFV